MGLKTKSCVQRAAVIKSTSSVKSVFSRKGLLSLLYAIIREAVFSRALGNQTDSGAASGIRTFIRFITSPVVSFG